MKKYYADTPSFSDPVPPITFKGRVLVIVPTYNERDNIHVVVDRVFANKGVDINILVVDDNSPDGTGAEVRQMMEKDTRLFLIERRSRDGLGTAYVAGFHYAIEKNYDVVFEMDADLSHQPEMIPYFLEAIEKADLVIGSRYLGKANNVVNWPITRLILSKGAGLYTRIITGMSIQDPTSGFKCFRIEALKQLNLNNIHSSGYSFQIEVNFKLWKKGLKVMEIPIIFIDRISGSSKMNKSIIREAIFAVWIIKLKSLFSKE